MIGKNKMTTATLTDYRILTIIQEEIDKFLKEQDNSAEIAEMEAELAKMKKNLAAAVEQEEEMGRELSELDKETVENTMSAFIETKDGVSYMAQCPTGPNGEPRPGECRPVTAGDFYAQNPGILSAVNSGFMILGNLGLKIKAKPGEEAKFTDADKIFGNISLKPIQTVGDKAVEIRNDIFMLNLGTAIISGLVKKFAPPVAKGVGNFVAKGVARMGAGAIAVGIGKTAAFRSIVMGALTAFGLGPGVFGLVVSIVVPIVLDVALEYLIVQKDVFGVRGGISKGHPKEQERLKKLAALRAKGQKKWPKEGEFVRGDVDLWPIPMVWNYCNSTIEDKKTGEIKKQWRPPAGWTGSTLSRREGGDKQRKNLYSSCEEIKRLYSVAAMSPRIMQAQFEQAASQNGRADTVKAFNEDYYPNAIFDSAGFVKFKGVVSAEENIALIDKTPPTEEEMKAAKVEPGTGPSQASSGATVRVTGGRRAIASDKAKQLQVARELETSVQSIQRVLVSIYGDEILPRHGVDNKYGPETKAAIERFQKDNGLEQTGIFGEKEFEAANSAIEKAKKEQADVS
tara:strand:- start:4222 stop:5928 length:1707 start_codon:yes stop_codon:yes gene_type:complete